jgi:hypothetical protein
LPLLPPPDAPACEPDVTGVPEAPAAAPLDALPLVATPLDAPLEAPLDGLPLLATPLAAPLEVLPLDALPVVARPLAPPDELPLATSPLAVPAPVLAPEPETLVDPDEPADTAFEPDAEAPEDPEPTTTEGLFELHARLIVAAAKSSPEHDRTVIRPPRRKLCEGRA